MKDIKKKRIRAFKNSGFIMSTVPSKQGTEDDVKCITARNSSSLNVNAEG